MNISSCCS